MTLDTEIVLAIDQCQHDAEASVNYQEGFGHFLHLIELMLQKIQRVEDARS